MPKSCCIQKDLWSSDALSRMKKNPVVSFLKDITQTVAVFPKQGHRKHRITGIRDIWEILISGNCIFEPSIDSRASNYATHDLVKPSLEYFRYFTSDSNLVQFNCSHKRFF